MKNLNVFINESTNPITEKYPNVLTLGDGEYNGILWGHCFLYENNKYYKDDNGKKRIMLEIEEQLNRLKNLQ